MTQTAKIYGAPPRNLGHIDISPAEMMFWLYCPIKLAGRHGIVVPPNLEQFWPIISACRADCEPFFWENSYVYLTAKTLWVTHENPGQRRGWHADGFGTDDLNYIWYDTEPTLFVELSELVSLTDDHRESMIEMEMFAEQMAPTFYEVKHLLRLDQSVLHRVGDFGEPGMRSFVKLSVSRHPFNLFGNSINHDLAPDWTYAKRSVERNPEVARLVDHAA